MEEFSKEELNFLLDLVESKYYLLDSRLPLASKTGIFLNELRLRISLCESIMNKLPFYYERACNS